MVYNRWSGSVIFHQLKAPSKFINKSEALLDARLVWSLLPLRNCFVQVTCRSTRHRKNSARKTHNFFQFAYIAAGEQIPTPGHRRKTFSLHTSKISAAYRVIRCKWSIIIKDHSGQVGHSLHLYAPCTGTTRWSGGCGKKGIPEVLDREETTKRIREIDWAGDLEITSRHGVKWNAPILFPMRWQRNWVNWWGTFSSRGWQWMNKCIVHRFPWSPRSLCSQYFAMCTSLGPLNCDQSRQLINGRWELVFEPQWSSKVNDIVKFTAPF